MKKEVFSREQVNLTNKLRMLSGEGLMECKKALINANWDLEEAQKVLKKSQNFKTRI